MARAVVLLSGGLDSATTLALALREGFECHAFTVRYGQRHAQEIECAARVAKGMGVASHRIVDADLTFARGSALTDPAVPVPKAEPGTPVEAGIPPTYVPARNTVLLALALAYAESIDAAAIFLGVNAVDYSGYPDCRPEFLEAFERVARIGTRLGIGGRQFRIHAPLLRSSKAEIVRQAIALGVDLAATLSCYDPGPTARPCGACEACRLRAKGFAEAGVADPARREPD